MIRFHWYGSCSRNFARMPRFSLRKSFVGALGKCLAGACLLALGACSTSSGMPSPGFLNASIARAYIPLEGYAYLILDAHGAGVRIAPGVAVTNAHNANLVDEDAVIGVSHDYDLLFFRDKQNVPLLQGVPYVGERVIAYGQGLDGSLRQAKGAVTVLASPVLPNCKGCPVQQAFVFEAPAGRGFSGGPVVDAQSGALLGITFGFVDSPRGLSRRHMYAYDMARVRTELAAVRKAAQRLKVER